MRIVIIGIGTIGRTILKNLAGEAHPITIIDEDKKLIEALIENTTYSVWSETVPAWIFRRPPTSAPPIWSSL